jgi:outer membrane protein TolC
MAPQVVSVVYGDRWLPAAAAIVPLAVFGALSAQLLRGFNNDVFCQVGLVLLVGLAAKNSILIVEFAEQLRERGLSIFDAAVESARIRLRPILMTSFAFILGVLPLALATGAGAASRNSVGTAVAGGMLASTFLSIFFIPVLYVVIRSLAPGRAHRDRSESASGPSPVTVGIVLAIGLALAAPAFAQAPSPAQDPRPATQDPRPTTQAPIERVTFDEAIARALEKNPTVALAATSILRSEALLQQARSVVMPRVTGNITNTTLDTGREFSGQVVQPQNQSILGLNATMPVLAASQWAARAQAMDQVEIARLSQTDTRRQIAVATATAYLTVIAQKRQVEVITTAIETARGQLDYNTKRREGGVGSRLNELRSSQLLSATQAQLEALQLNVRRAQEALGVLLATNGPVDVNGEPTFEVPSEVAETEWLPNRPDIRVFTETARANERIVNDSRKDWWPSANVVFGPQLLTPAGLFQPSRTWSLSVQLSQPIFEGGQRKSLRHQREALFQASNLSLERAQISARSEVRIARAAVEARERALAAARQASETANEVLKITIIAFDAGSTTNIEVIDAQRSARDQESAVAQAEDALRQARLELLVALGRFPK